MRGLFFAMAAALVVNSTAISAWGTEYYASSLVYPENNGEGWTLENQDAQFQRGFVNNTLWQNTMTGDQFSSMDWRNTGGTFDFVNGFVMEARVKLVRATTDYPDFGGAVLYARSISSYNMLIEVDVDGVMLQSGPGAFPGFKYAMNTTDAFHTYRAVAQDNVGTLYVDDVSRLTLPLDHDNTIQEFFFGDNGWEGAEMYWDYVAYGVPEPGSFLMILLGAGLVGRRTRVRSGQCRMAKTQ